MDPLIQLLVIVLFIAIAAYYLPTVLERFKMPAPAFWIVGTILIIFILVFLANQLGVGGSSLRWGH